MTLQKRRGKEAFDTISTQFPRERQERARPSIPIEEKIRKLLAKRGFPDEAADNFVSFFDELFDDEDVTEEDLIAFSSRLLTRLAQPMTDEEKKGDNSVNAILSLREEESERSVGKVKKISPGETIATRQEENGETIRSLTDKFMQGVHNALISGSEWEKGNLDYFHYNDEYSGYQYSLGTRDKNGKFTPMTEAEFREQFGHFGAESSLVCRLVLALWTEAYFNGTLEGGEALTIPMNYILEIEGEKKSDTMRAFKPERKREIFDKLYFLASLDAHGTRKIYEGKKKKKEVTQTITGKVLEILTKEEREREGINPSKYSLTIRPGLAARPFFVDDGNRLIGHFFLALAKLNVNKPGIELNAFLIGMYISAIFRNREHAGNYGDPISIKTILQGSKIVFEEKQKRPGDFKDYFESALDLLIQIGVIGGWEYAEGDFDRINKLQDANKHGWFSEWITCKIAFVPPQVILNSGKIRTENYRAHIKEALRQRALREQRLANALAKKNVEKIALNPS